MHIGHNLNMLQNNAIASTTIPTVATGTTSIVTGIANSGTTAK
jgi:hypothetical protein